jgi:hypothetical protein
MRARSSMSRPTQILSVDRRARDNARELAPVALTDAPACGPRIVPAALALLKRSLSGTGRGTSPAASCSVASARDCECSDT